MLTLVAGLTPWMGSVSSSIQVPVTMNSLVSMAAASPRGFFPGNPKVVSRPGGPAFLLPQQPAPSMLHKRLPFPATELGVVWRGDGPPPYLRTSRNGLVWTRWKQVEPDADMYDETTGVHYSSLVAGRKARFAQLRPAEGSGARSFKIAVINTSDGPQTTVGVRRSAHAATGKPEVISRAAWGADESIRGAGGAFTRAKSIFVHHTNTPNNDGDPAGTIRAIYSYHVKTRGFHDIGYNFLIDPRGKIYEGRHSTSPPPGETPSGEDAGGRTVLGAHTKDHNARSIGVAVMGNSDTAQPTAGAIESLVGLLAWAADRHGIDPLRKFTHVSPATGAIETLHNISGHKDSSSTITECPGAILYSQLPALRQRVEETIASTSSHSPPSMPVASSTVPASPSTSMTPNVQGDVSRTATRVEVVFEGAAEAGSRTISVTPQNGSFQVTNASFDGQPLKPGIYTVRAVAFDAEGRPSPPAIVAAWYELRRPSALPALDAIVTPLLSPPLTDARGSDLARAMSTVIKLLGL